MAGESERSVGWVVVMLVLVIAWFGWSFCAAEYAQTAQTWDGTSLTEMPDHGMSADDRATALGDFFENAVLQIPHAVSVVKFSLTRRLWLVGLVVAIEAVALGVGWKMKNLEREFSKPARRSKS